MTRILATLTAMTAASSAFAGTDCVKVPEVGMTGSIAALAVVAAIGVMLWERRRKA